MKIGVGLPNPVPGTSGETLLGWARRAEELGFSTLATIDRIVYPSYESLIALAGAAAVTEQVGLLTNILIAPTRDTRLLAKESASVDRISNGRLTLGLGVGGRGDDFEAVGRPMKGRGKRFEAQLEELHELWRGKTISDTEQPSVPLPGREIPLLIGGSTDVARRVARWGTGFTAGGAPPEMVAPIVDAVRKGWAEAGRDGEPRIVSLAYFALGPDAEEGASRYLLDYYGFLGDIAQHVAQGAPKTPEALKEVATRFEGIGTDELILDPTIASLDQLDRLAEVLL